ncbi:MAG: hypothetical protein EZS28_013866, partial [Streblomastix strix]
IDSYTKGETNNLLNNKADTGVSYTKGEDDALLLLKANQSTTYTKGEDDALLLLKADKTQLIDSYSKSETYARDEVITKTEINNQFSNKTDTEVNLSFKADTALLDDQVTTNMIQYIDGEKKFNANINAIGNVKIGKDDTSVLLAEGSDDLSSSLGKIYVEEISNLIVSLNSNIRFNYLELAERVCTIGSISNTITPPTPPSTTYPISLATKRKTLIYVLSFGEIRITTDSSTPWGIDDEVDIQFSWML